MSKQLKDREISAVANDISLAFNNQVRNVLPEYEAVCEKMDKISDPPPPKINLT